MVPKYLKNPVKTLTCCAPGSAAFDDYFHFLLHYDCCHLLSNVNAVLEGNQKQVCAGLVSFSHCQDRESSVAQPNK